MWDHPFSFTPLGGGLEIGANSFYFEWDDLHFLIDAGAHPERPGYLSIPSFYRIRRLDFVLITHAHHDHIGSLPYLHTLFPDTPVYMTEGTLELARVMLGDALKFARVADSIEREPFYTRRDIDSLMANIRFPGEILRIGDLEITPFDSGHILGGVGYLLEKNGKRVVFTSDISQEIKSTSPPLRIPAVKADLVISESTYGRDAKREFVTERGRHYQELINTVSGIVERGGSVLFPSFVIERAQEIALILGEAIRSGQLRRVPVYVSGLAIPISEIHEDILGLDLDCEFTGRNQLRLIVEAGDPFILITGSGMLNSSSTSAEVAERLLSERRNAVIFTGYCAPTSTGYRLIHRRSNHFYINGHFVHLESDSVYQFHISCHASGRDLVKIMGGLRPDQIILTHGDADSIEVLRAAMNELGYMNIHLPGNDETISFGDGTVDLDPPVGVLKNRLRVAYERSPDEFLKVANEILSKTPWDLETLEEVVKRTGAHMENVHSRKFYLILKLLCERAMREGNFSVAWGILERMSRYYKSNYTRKNVERVKRFLKRIGKSGAEPALSAGRGMEEGSRMDPPVS
jgi:Cft2 family RNA processing exonuclease